MLLEADAVAGEGDVVIGRKQGDQAKNETTDGLGETLRGLAPVGSRARPEPAG